MTFGELKLFVTEAIGEDVLSFDKLVSGVRSGFGDMTHRGYREFKNITSVCADGEQTEYEKLFRMRYPKADISSNFPRFTNLGREMAVLDYPSDCLEILYVKLFFENKSYVATKLALSNQSIQAKNKNGFFRTDFSTLDYENAPACIYYKKGDQLFFEWNIYQELSRIEIGYYKKLPALNEKVLRKMVGISDDDALDIEDIEIPMPEDYCNVLVNFMIWYVASSNGWEQEQLTILKNEYKYSMEDLLARKDKEDQYDETTTVVRIDGRM